MIDRRRVEAHLAFFRELGVEGVHRDPLWRRRPADGPAVPAAAPPEADAAGGDATAVSSPATAPPASAPASPPSATPDGPPPAAPSPAPAAAPPATAPAHTAPSPAPAAAPPATAPAHTAPSPAPADPASGVEPVAASGAAVSMFDQVAAPTGDSGRSRLEAVQAELGPCTRCKLHGGRTNLVFGVGNPEADLMFVGEAPGRDEDRQGIPFVGRAGELLTRIIEAIDLRRDDVYIANVIKCRPPDNRNPEPDEVQTCQPFLFAQIDAIRPRVLVALGSFAARALLGDDRASITRVRGREYRFRGARLIPTFHPAYLLRSPERKREVWEDMKRVRALLRAG